MPLKTVRIVSDGTPAGTKLLDPDGKPLPGVAKVFWIVSAGGGLATAVVTFGSVKVDVEGQLVADSALDPEALAKRLEVLGTRADVLWERVEAAIDAAVVRALASERASLTGELSA